MSLLTAGCRTETPPSEQARSASNARLVSEPGRRAASATAIESVVDCPQDVTCISQLPQLVRGNTSGSARSDIDTYSCARTVDASGPEVWYRVNLSERGFLALELSELPEGVDVDVYVLDADKKCLFRGDERAGAFVNAGRYWVVVDTWVSKKRGPQPGRYALSLGHTKVTDLVAAGMRAAVADRALKVFDRAWKRRKTKRFEYAITDFSLHSSQKRQWIYDLKTGALLWHLHVAHGEGSSDPGDPGYAQSFSNQNASHQSSLGLMKTGELYTGTFGPSHRLDGLERGVNANVRDRAIVVHPWSGSRASFVRSEGYVEPTWGCPAIDDRIADEVRQRMAGGALMWFWAPDPAFLAKSAYLK